MRVSPAVSTRTTARGARLDRLRGQLEAAAPSRGCWSRSSRKIAAQRSSPPRRPSRSSSLWSASGSVAAEGRELGVLVDLRLPATRHRRGQVGAVDDRRPRRRPAPAISLACCCSASALLAEEGGRGVDLGVDARPDPGQRGELGGDDDHVGDRGARLEDPRQADHRHARSRARRSTSGAAGAGDAAAARRAPRPPRSRRASPRSSPE